MKATKQVFALSQSGDQTNSKVLHNRSAHVNHLWVILAMPTALIHGPPWVIHAERTPTIANKELQMDRHIVPPGT